MLDAPRPQIVQIGGQAVDLLEPLLEEASGLVEDFVFADRFASFEFLHCRPRPFQGLDSVIQKLAIASGFTSNRKTHFTCTKSEKIIVSCGMWTRLATLTFEQSDLAVEERQRTCYRYLHPFRPIVDFVSNFIKGFLEHKQAEQGVRFKDVLGKTGSLRSIGFREFVV